MVLKSGTRRGLLSSILPFFQVKPGPGPWAIVWTGRVDARAFGMSVGFFEMVEIKNPACEHTGACPGHFRGGCGPLPAFFKRLCVHVWRFPGVYVSGSFDPGNLAWAIQSFRPFRPSYFREAVGLCTVFRFGGWWWF